ncbi:MAG: hypothetical protein ABI178_11370 [Rhodanobacter sp.]
MPLTLITRGPKHGRCNICGAIGPLTEDHTPPKGCVRPSAMMLEHASDRLAVQRGVRAKANDGVKYRTLCARCNNSLLGGRYDPALIDFVNEVTRLLESPLLLPSSMTVLAKPRLIARAVWGHMAVVGVERYQKGRDTALLRDFFLDESIPIPQNLNFYYWLYPYRRQALIKDAGALDFRGGNAIYWLLKFYPMAFAMWTTTNAYHLSHRDLASHSSGRAGDVSQVIIDLSPIEHELVLEAPSDTQGLMFGREAIVANKRPPRARILRL